MNIALNLTPYDSGSTGGLGVYVKTLLLEFPKISPEDKFFVFCEKRHAKEFGKYNVKLILFPD